ncbi:MAG: hypothetical protein ABIH56_04520 [Candidatus Margulisiibacteriota bacterium]
MISRLSVMVSRIRPQTSMPKATPNIRAAKLGQLSGLAAMATAAHLAIGCSFAAEMLAPGKEQTLADASLTDVDGKDVLTDTVEDVLDGGKEADALADVALDTIIDVDNDTPDVLPDVLPDVEQDSPLDTLLDVIPDITEDVVQDVAEDIKPDIIPDVIEEGDADLPDTVIIDQLTDPVNDPVADQTEESETGWTCPSWLFYNGSDLPENDGWDAPTGALAGMCAPAGGVLLCDTSTATSDGYYSVNPGFNNATGSVVKLQLQINGLPGATSPSMTGFSLAVADGQRKLQFNFFADKVCEPANLGDCSTISLNTAAWHEYMLVFKGNNYQLFANGQILIDGTGLSLTGASGENYIRFGAFVPMGGQYNIDYLDYCLSSQ